MALEFIKLNKNIEGWYSGTKAAIEALTGIPVPSIGFGWTTAPDDGEFGVYNGVSWEWGTGGAAGALLAANNLSDLSNLALAKANLNYDASDVTFTPATTPLSSGYVGQAIEEVYEHFDGNVIPADGWQDPGAAWSFASADDPVFQIYATGNMTLNPLYKVGNRVKCTNSSTTFYGIIVKVGAYDSGNTRTPIDIYGGTDYDLANSAISDPFISQVKSPAGFPLDPLKWTVRVTNTANNTQSSPVISTWYNVTNIVVPIGLWRLRWRALLYATVTSGTGANEKVTLSTANNTESDSEFTGEVRNVGASGTIHALQTASAEKIVSLTAKSTRYLNMSTGFAVTNIAIRGDVIPAVLEAESAYL